MYSGMRYAVYPTSKSHASPGDMVQTDNDLHKRYISQENASKS